MSFALMYLQKIILGFRWVVLFILFLLYGKTESIIISSFFIFIFINLVWVLLFFYSLKQKYWIWLAVFDLFLSISILIILGGANNPFILYTFLSLLWFSTFLREKSVYSYTVFYVLTTLFIWFGLFYSSGGIEWTGQHHFLLKAVSVYLIYLIFYFLLKTIRETNKRWGQVARFIQRLNMVTAISELNMATEKVIKSVFKIEQVYICWFDTFVNDDWSVSYYTRVLIDQHYDRYKRKSVITIQDYLGKSQNFFFFPLSNLGDEKNTGAIIIPIKEKSAIKPFFYIYLHIIAASIVSQNKHIKLQQEVESAMKETVRKKMAQDMHDGLAQQLFFLSAQLFQVKNTLKQGNQDNMNDLICKMEDQVKQCHLEVRNYISYLRDEHRISNILDAIDQLLTRVKKTTGIEVELIVKGHVNEETVDIEEVIYRLIEECVNNSLKHATPTKVTVTIEATMVQWTVKITDNGKGMEQKVSQSTKKSYGMIGIHERVDSVGGNLFVRSTLGEGTEIVAIIPRGRIQAYV
ncbi:ATP-binding protein [Alkalihalobacterium chitinilyticum]|uniref:histidine kinase n=1 Tax=Alkalihalobacterium chitinilyticum TaxID=2980103 RepID=A0ABT5VGM5_9BACI|nr:ATP-binding protein [Alkalihalobacterium chitinilyticum]MDE5414607.1 histidine kinase [Alkalihalobacterium chitinilyticum]